MSSGKFHWLSQRLTALVLLPLIFWFIYQFIKIKDFSYEEILIFFESEINSYLFCTMMLLIIYHGKLGMQIIIEDYTSNKILRNNIIILTNIFSYILMIVSLLSIFSIQFYK